MSDRVRIVGHGAGPAPSSRRALPWAIAIVAIAAAFLIGRATGDSGGSTSHVAGSGPTRTEFGVPVGYAHSRAGAVAAAFGYGATSAGEDFLNPERRRIVLDIIATPAFARRYEQRATPALAEALRGPLGRGLRVGAPTILLSAPLAYRVVSYSSQRAVIAGWGAAVSANTVGLKPQVDFQTTTSTLVWRNGDWKLDDGRIDPGPTPAPAIDTQPTSAGTFVNALNGMQSSRYEP